MKNLKFLALAALAFVAFSAQAFELGGEFLATSLSIPWTQVQASASSVSQFVPSYFFGGSVYGTETLADSFSLTASYQLDPVLRSFAGAILKYHAGFAELSVGPTFGVFNSASAILKSGISAGIKIEYPGLAFLGFRSDSSIGAGMSVVGDYIQESSEINAGFYVPNAICSFNMITKSFQQKASASMVTADSFNEYSLKIDLFKKNVPYNLLMTLGYQTLGKTFTEGSTQTTDRIGSVIIGARFKLQVTSMLGFLADFQANVHTFGLDNLLARGPSADSFQFHASLGASIKIGEGEASRASVFSAKPAISKEEEPEENLKAEKAVAEESAEASAKDAKGTESGTAEAAK